MKYWYLGFILTVYSCVSSENKNDFEQSFLNEIGVTTSFRDGNELSKSGYLYIEESVGGFLMPSKDSIEFEEVLNEAKKYPLPVKVCNLFIPGYMKSVGNEAVHSEILDFAEIVFKRAKKAKVEIIVFGSGGSRQVPEGFEYEKAWSQFVTLSKRMADIAKAYDVIIALEPLNKGECNFINSVSEGGQMVEAVDHPNFRLHVDIYHMLKEGESPENIERYGQFIVHSHIAEKKDRAAPGTYNEDFSPYLQALKEIEFKGRLSIECNWTDMEEQSPLAYKVIRDQINKLE